MAMDLATAKKAAQQVGATPPPEWAGNEDGWYMAWFQEGVNSGDPRLVKLAGGTLAEGGGADDVIADCQNAAPSSEWLGKRNPTPGELRKFAVESGQSEDYARFSDRQLSAWIKKSWKGDHFENDYGDRVEKPSEDGPNSAGRQALFNTGKYGDDPNAVQVGGGGGGGGGGGKKAPVDEGAAKTQMGKPGELKTTGNPLQDALINMFNQRGGIMGRKNSAGVIGAENDNPIQGVSLAGGGMMWGNDLVNALKNKPTVDQTVYAPGQEPANPAAGGGTITAPSAVKSTGLPGPRLDVPSGPGWMGGTPGAPPGGGVPRNPLSGVLVNQAQGNVGGLTGVPTNPFTPVPSAGAVAPQSAPQMLQPAATSNPLTPVLKRQFPTSPLPGGNRWWA